MYHFSQKYPFKQIIIIIQNSNFFKRLKNYYFINFIKLIVKFLNHIKFYLNTTDKLF